MSFKIKKISKFLIASILFGQLNTVFAQSFHGSEDSFINLCTPYGIKKIQAGNKDIDKEIQVTSMTMHCCLDFQSSFIFSKQNFLTERKTLYAFLGLDENTISKQTFNNYFSIRAPPNFSKI